MHDIPMRERLFDAVGTIALGVVLAAAIFLTFYTLVLHPMGLTWTVLF